MSCKNCNGGLYGDREILRGVCTDCSIEKEIEKQSKREDKIVRYKGQRLRKHYNWYEFQAISGNLRQAILVYIREQRFGERGFRVERHTYWLPGFDTPKTNIRLSCKNNNARKDIYSNIAVRRDWVWIFKPERW